MEKIRDYFSGVKSETKKIRWTSPKNLLQYSIATVTSMLFLGLFFYLIDLLIATLRSII